MQETPDYAGIAGRLEATCHEACTALEHWRNLVPEDPQDTTISNLARALEALAGAYPQACNALLTAATNATAERALLQEMSEIEMEPIDVASDLDLEWMDLERTELDEIDIDKLRDA